MYREKYNPQEIEPKWQEIWQKTEINKAIDFSKKPKFYSLDMFPYPSGEGMHIGHVENYTGTDIYSRYLRMNGKNVLHPIGWDAFGLPAENFAIKHGIHPAITTKNNIAKIRKQCQAMGFSYDWDREINTTDSDYYRWTQWIFLLMFKRGLAYEDEAPINWCPSCKTGLANEEVIDGSCERCGTEVTKKKLKQWLLKITAYADRLLSDLKNLDWPENIKAMQENWIGKSEGSEILFKTKLSSREEFDISVFTTRADTLFGATYLVLAPENELVQKFLSDVTNKKEIEDYISKTKNKTEIERTDIAKEKTGIELKGIKAINPVNNEELPIWIADYILADYGTGAIMAVPAHDVRDFQFANKYKLPIKPVIFKKDLESRSFVMGIDEDKLRKIKVNILEKTNKGFFKIKIPYKNLGDYKKLIREEMQAGFWNEFSTEKGFYFIFKHKDGHIEEMELNERSNDVIDKYGAIFNGEKIPEKSENVYSWQSWISEDAFYHDLLIHTEDGTLINSSKYSGLTSEKAKEKIIKWLEEKGQGKKTTNYKLRDWIFSRQRYWGEPIPIVHCQKCGVVPVSEKDLPVKLPEVKNYQPTGTGESPLASIRNWVNVKCPKCNQPAKRETNTMPQWAGSCWYFLRYADPKNNKEIFDKKKIKYWLPADLYVGGAEHAVLHLLYSRFWMKVLYDEGLISFEEPFIKLVNQGLILASDGQKMSKSKGNIINPDDIIKKYGADTLRLYVMFIGPFEDSKAWDSNGIEGIVRFLKKVWGLSLEVAISKSKFSKPENFPNPLREVVETEIKRLLHKTIKKVTEDIEKFGFNTVISSLMELVNGLMEAKEKVKIEEAPEIWREAIGILLTLLSPFAPHISEELWQKLGFTESIFAEIWPSWDEKIIKEDTVTLVIQVNGKVRDELIIPVNSAKNKAYELATESGKVKKYIDKKKIVNTIYIKDKLINIVVKE